MVRVLVVDDEPVRADQLMAVCDLRVAHGFEQVKFWLRNTCWRPDVVFLDNDMPLATGLSIARFFANDLIGIPVVIWSMNPIAAKEIEATLQDAQIEGIHWPIVVDPYNPKRTSGQWLVYLNNIQK